MGHFYDSSRLKESTITDKKQDVFGAGLKALETVEIMKRHPNYTVPKPLPNESKTAFILRSVAHLISPPQEDKESSELECIDIAQAVIIMEKELEKIWECEVIIPRLGPCHTWEVIADFHKGKGYKKGDIVVSGAIGEETQMPYYKYPEIFKMLK